MDFLPTLVEALWGLKGMYDQHGVNKDEIKRLQEFIKGYEALLERLKECELSGTSVDDIKNLETVIIEATKKLTEWSADKRFFRVINAPERMQELERLQTNVISSTLTTLGLVNMGMQLRLGAKQEELMAMQKKFFEEMRHRAQPVQKRADQASSTMNRMGERYVWKDCQEPYPISNIKHDVLKEDHRLVAAEEGVVYVIWKDPSTAHTNVSMQITGQNGFISPKYSKPFQSTCPPCTSSAGKLYLGGKMLPGGRPTVLVWKAERFFCALESARAGETRWEYTFLTQSATGLVLYCGCSDGTIEVWTHVYPNQPRVHSGQLTGVHAGGISHLAVGENGTLISVDKKHRNIVRVWCQLKLVATLDLKHEEVYRMACTLERKLYIATKGGSKMWCDLQNIVDHATLGGPGMNLGPSLKYFGLEMFSPLQHPNRGPTSANVRASSCLVVHGATKTVYFLCTMPYQKTHFIEEWRGNELVSRIDTGLERIQSWTVSRNGKVYCSSRSTGVMSMWKLIK